VRRLNWYEVIEIWWLSVIENFGRERDCFIFNSFRSFKPVKRFQNRSGDVLEFWSLDNSSSKSILDILETIYLIFWKTILQRVAVIQFGVYNDGGNCFGGVTVKVGTDTAKSRNVMIAGFRQCRDLIGEWEMFIKYEARAASRFSSVETLVLNKRLQLMRSGQ